MSKVIGIISYFPSKQPDRDLRIERFNSLLSTLDTLFPKFPVIIVAQNWSNYKPKTKRELLVHRFGKLGILNARRTLRTIFLESPYENMITLDDDAIIRGESAEEFLRQIDASPDGMGVFCWEHSQLNLLYISKYIYSRVELPNIDPEMDEGFEDVVFTSTCKQMFPDKVFTFFNTGLTEVSFRYTGENKVPSTWAGGNHDWGKLRSNTKEIKDKLENNIDLNDAILSVVKSKKPILDKIDIVVPYVDSSDPNWQALYNKHAPNLFKEDSNGKQRFRKNDLFRYWFRSVDQYIPWVNNIFLLVQSISQVPTWLLNTDKIKIITHEQFIPIEYLPTFNSQTIEMFLHRIPGLSEMFLYSNDDIYFIGPLKPEDYFTSNGVRTDFKVTQLDNINPMPLWRASILNSGYLVNREEIEKLKSQNSYITPMHVTRPYLKSELKEVYETHEQEILKSLSKFREPQNFTVYIYDFHMRVKGLTFPKSYLHHHFSNRTPVNLIGNCMANPLVNKVMCLNDTVENVNALWDRQVKEKFLDKYPKKSQYEV